MNTTQSLPSVMSQASRPALRDRARLFYAGAAMLLLVLMFLRFQ